jgi:hypothetical protein
MQGVDMVSDGKYLSAEAEDSFRIAQANAELNEQALL